MLSTISYLQCSRATCGETFSYSSLRNLCTLCGAPLIARYDLDKARSTFTLEAIGARTRSMWRYEEVLPGAPAVTLGEGMTPLIHALRLGEQFGLSNLYIKDEGLNPTASFKARGLSAAVTMAKALGAKTVALPTAGNAGGAAAAYAAKAGRRLRREGRTAVRDCDAGGYAVGQCDGVAGVRRRRPVDRWPDIRLWKVH